MNDNPRSVDEALQLITCVQMPIQGDPNTGKASAARIWEGMGLDALILSSPQHDGRTIDLARQTYHRLTARLIGAQMHTLQQRHLILAGRWAMASSVLMVTPLLFLAPIISIGLIIYAFNMRSGAAGECRSINVNPLKEEALGAVQRCFIRAFPGSAPEDLADVWRHGWYTNEGRPISSEIVDTDATSLAALEVANGWNACFQTILMLALVGTIPGCGILLLAMLLPALRGRLGPNPGSKRAQELDRRQAVEGALLVSAGGIEWSKHQEQARMLQIAEAMRDQTPVLHLGVSTGILAGRGDCYAPSPGIPFNMSLTDLQNHLLVLGGTGSGKTSGVLRPIAHQIAAHPMVGLVVMDGKAALPGELSSLTGMQIIDPRAGQFSLVAGLSPVELVDTLVDVLSSGSESDPYWTNAAAGLLRRAAVLAHYAGGDHWTLDGIGRLATNPKAVDELKDKFTDDELMENPQLTEAVFFFSFEWMDMDSKPKSSIMSHAMTWLSTITAHPDLLRWAQTKAGEDTFDLLRPLKGGRLGFLIPSHRYGRAGAVVTALLKARIYAALKARAESGTESGGTPVVFVIDEAQEVATRDDATMLSIGRSLGLAMVGATQTIEGITEKLGDKPAAKWLAVYGSAISLTGRSPATDEFMTKRAGATWKAEIRTVPGVSVKDSITSAVFSGSIAAARKQTSMRQFASAAPSPLSPFVERARMAMASQSRAIPSTDPRDQREPDEGVTSIVGPVPLVHANELATLLAEPNLALIVAIRGRVPRRDVVKLSPKFA